MSVDLKKTASNGDGKMLLQQEQQAKIIEVRRLIGPLSDKGTIYCSDASISRYLKSQNWNVKKAAQMLRQSLKWREEYKPEEICWEEVSNEGERGEMYRTNYDKHGRSVIVMRLCHQNSKSVEGRIKYFVYCMENAILNLPPHQEQVIWLVDFHGFNLSNLLFKVSFKVARETIHIIQQYYPERLGYAILYNAPKLFQPFFKMIKPLLEPETCNKVKFCYSHDHNTEKMMEDLFDMDHLESAFGGNNVTGFDINKYAERMKEDDKKTHSFWTQTNSLSSVSHNPPPLDSISLYADSDASNDKKIDCSQL